MMRFRKKRKTVQATSFQPITITDGSVIYEAKRVEHRMFYDSTWCLLVSTANNILSTIQLVRSDTETIDDLSRAIKSCVSVEDLQKLDKKMSIYYD